MSTLIMIRGNLGSGKSSVAKMLQRKIGRNTLLISQDIIRREMLWVRDGKDTEALPLLIMLLKYGKSHCKYVILGRTHQICGTRSTEGLVAHRIWQG